MNSSSALIRLMSVGAPSNLRLKLPACGRRLRLNPFSCAAPAAGRSLSAFR